MLVQHVLLGTKASASRPRVPLLDEPAVDAISENEMNARAKRVCGEMVGETEYERDGSGCFYRATLWVFWIVLIGNRHMETSYAMRNYRQWRFNGICW